jgi:hypothetical protein
MKLRRLVPLALAAFSAWRRLSPEQKQKLRSTITGLGNRTRVATARGTKP